MDWQRHSQIVTLDTNTPHDVESSCLGWSDVEQAHRPMAGQCLRISALHRQNIDHSSLFLTSAHLRSSPIQCQLTGVKTTSQGQQDTDNDAMCIAEP